MKLFMLPLITCILIGCSSPSGDSKPVNQRPTSYIGATQHSMSYIPDPISPDECITVQICGTPGIHVIKHGIQFDTEYVSDNKGYITDVLAPPSTTIWLTVESDKYIDWDYVDFISPDNKSATLTVPDIKTSEIFTITILEIPKNNG